MTWETVIGLEIHVQLNTQFKIFSGASTAFGAEPNAHASVVECALPGVLPVMNREVVEKAIKLGLALDAKINQKNVFDRKNYFYPLAQRLSNQPVGFTDCRTRQAGNRSRRRGKNHQRNPRAHGRRRGQIRA